MQSEVPARPTTVRHLVVFLTALSAFILYLHRFYLSFAERFIKDDLQLSDDQIGWLFSAFFLAYSLGQVPAGWLGDRFGIRKMFTLYIVLWSLFTGLMGVAFVFGLLVVFRLACGLAQAGAFPVSSGLLSHWVPLADRGKASAVVSLGGRIGGFAAPVITAYLVSGLALGWRPIMVIYGIAGLLAAWAFWYGFRDNPREHPFCNPEEVAIIEKGRDRSGKRPGRANSVPLLAMVRSSSLWCSSLTQFGTNIGWTFLVTWLARYLKDVHKVPDMERGWMTGLPLLVGIAGMIVGGWATDRMTRAFGLRWGRALPMSLSRFIAMAAFLACLLLDSPWPVCVAMACVAAATDLGTPALWAFTQDAGGRHVGSVLGWSNMWGNFGATLSPPLLNWMVKHYGWNGVFVTCAAGYLIAGLAGLGVNASKTILPATSQD